MAEEAEQREVGDEATPEKTPSRHRWSFGQRLFSTKGLVILVGVSVLLHALGFTYARLSKADAPVKETSTPETDLGCYTFVANPSEQSDILGAEFALHIALLKHAEAAALKRLTDRKYRVQQNVEQLLRQAHGGDFDDPALGELKRVLQEQINATLDMRAIDEGEGGASADATSGKVPWIEGSASGGQAPKGSG
jgi:hypothetical protein